MQQSLDRMNVQVHRAVSGITGRTAMVIARAIAGGERDALKLAALRDRRCGKSAAESAEHLTGTWRGEHLCNPEQSLLLYASIQSRVEACERRLEEELAAQSCEDLRERQPPEHRDQARQRKLRSRGKQPRRAALWRFAAADLTAVDGIGAGSALTILAEAGLDLSAFPAEKHFASGLRLSPRTAVSGGKALSKKKARGMGASRVTAALRMCAVSLWRSDTALGAMDRRKARRKGAGVAVFAVARQLAVHVYRLLRHGQEYMDVGAAPYEARFEARRLASLKHSAKALGFTLVPQAPEPAGSPAWTTRTGSLRRCFRPVLGRGPGPLRARPD